MTHNFDQTLLRISCVLSVVGSLITMLVCAQIGVLQKRKGRDLIFWLSFTDFASSFIYFLSSFETDDNGKNTNLCKTYALLGIFFPVSSFLWTNFIAYYLYDMVVNRQNVGEKEWSKLMFSFHAIAWGVSALCILLVGAFDHAGRDSDSETNNTGGWCWVRADSSRDLLLWELVGGKFIEWTSCLFVLPYLYSATIYRLILLDNGWDSLMVDNDTMRSTMSSSRSGKVEHTFSLTCASVVGCYFSILQCLKCNRADAENPLNNSSFLGEDLFSNHEEDSPFRLSDNNLSRIDSKDLLSANCSNLQSDRTFADCRPQDDSSSYREGGDHSQSKFNRQARSESSSSMVTVDTLGSLVSSGRHPTPDLSAGSRTSSDHSKVLKKPSFRQFYLKMAIVPVVFFLCRIWGSVRIIIHFASSSSDSSASIAASTWLQTMQAIFDPAMGFFNAVIFVFMSQQDRDAFFQIIFSAKLYRYVRSGCICTLLFGASAVRLREVPANNSSTRGRLTNPNQRACYQGEDSEQSASEGYRGASMGGDGSFSSHFDFTESSASYNINTY